ncbi:hypothetical protein R3P38DRAFT_3626908 [Favolaschia claudopus]|uniref:Uncharacterized protein n=1 Tax=Favolaschia claudopus TaxID=2862362 RepID=A0AAW0A0Q7_9AGAR
MLISQAISLFGRSITVVHNDVGALPLPLAAAVLLDADAAPYSDEITLYPRGSRPETIRNKPFSTLMFFQSCQQTILSHRRSPSTAISLTYRTAEPSILASHCAQFCIYVTAFSVSPPAYTTGSHHYFQILVCHFTDAAVREVLAFTLPPYAVVSTVLDPIYFDPQPQKPHPRPPLPPLHRAPIIASWVPRHTVTCPPILRLPCHRTRWGGYISTSTWFIDTHYPLRSEGLQHFRGVPLNLALASLTRPRAIPATFEMARLHSVSARTRRSCVPTFVSSRVTT